MFCCFTFHLPALKGLQIILKDSSFQRIYRVCCTCWSTEVLHTKKNRIWLPYEIMRLQSGKLIFLSSSALIACCFVSAHIVDQQF